jgi:hypothetical protein
MFLEPDDLRLALQRWGTSISDKVRRPLLCDGRGHHQLADDR